MISRADYARVIAAERVLVDALKRIAVAHAPAQHLQLIARDALNEAYPPLRPSQPPKSKRRRTAATHPQP